MSQSVKKEREKKGKEKKKSFFKTVSNGTKTGLEEEEMKFKPKGKADLLVT